LLGLSFVILVGFVVVSLFWVHLGD
jgi:hypothetical protein